MKKKTSLSEEDQALFRQLMTGTRKIAQDTIVHRPQRKKSAKYRSNVCCRSRPITATIFQMNFSRCSIRRAR
jgi:DNA-nicking Smr family endonuclease